MGRPGDPMASAIKRAAVLGKPIAHSLSPTLHRAAYRALGLDWSYDAIEVDEAGLPGILGGLDASWAGLSLTMPCKTAVIPLLDTVSHLARLVGSVNTVLLQQGKLVGENTDVFGIVQAVRELGAPRSDRALLLGGGATARSALAALAQMGVTQVAVCARRPQAVAELEQLARALGLTMTSLPWLGASAADAGWAHLYPWMRAGTTISTLPASAWSVVPVVPTGHGSAGWLLDVTYAPNPPPLVAAWRHTGGEAAGGLGMLLWQAVEQVRLMTGLSVGADVVAAMRAALPA